MRELYTKNWDGVNICKLFLEMRKSILVDKIFHKLWHSFTTIYFHYKYRQAHTFLSLNKNYFLNLIIIKFKGYLYASLPKSLTTIDYE